MIEVQAAPAEGGFDCVVELGAPGRTARHNVRVATKDLKRWARPGETPESLVARSFEFLLQREPAHQVLKSFALSDIGRYFPEFDEAIR